MTSSLNPGHQWLDPAWMQAGIDALRDTLDVLPTVKAQMIRFLFAAGLWDEKSLTWDAATARFNANLNPGKQGFFKVAEVVALSIAFRRPAFLRWWAEQAGFELRQKETIERQNELLERIAVAAEAYNRVLAEAGGDLRRLGMPVPASPIHPAIRERSSGFRLGDGEEADGPEGAGF